MDANPKRKAPAVSGAKSLMPKQRAETPGLFRHLIQTTPRLDLRVSVRLGQCVFKTWSSEDAAELSDRLRRRNVFARHSWERELYVGKAEQLRNSGALEFMIPGEHKHTATNLRLHAAIHERILFLVATYRHSRDQILARMGISVHSHNDDAVDLLLTDNLKHISTRTKRNPARRRIAVNQATARRIRSFGISDAIVEAIAAGASEMSRRIRRALTWLEEARLEAGDDAAAVKTSIGFECLFVFNDSEPLKKSISERVAFLLGQTAVDRERLAKIISQFYDIRSGIVHGGRRAASPSEIDLGAVERLLLLSCIALASRSAELPSADAWRRWFEEMRWSTSVDLPALPFGRRVIASLMK